mgnify:CR=1 FL=1
MSLSKEFPQVISVLTKIMSTRQAKAALRKAKKGMYRHGMSDHSYLECVFVWKETPQGHNFWSKINRKIGKCSHGPS